MAHKYDILLPPPPSTTDYWEKARRQGGDWTWAFNQYVVPPGCLGLISDEGLQRELLDAHRRFRLPEGSANDPSAVVSHSSILEWILSRLSALRQAELYWAWSKDIERDMAFHHTRVAHESKSACLDSRGTTARIERIKAKQASQQQVLETLKTKHTDSLLLSGLDGLFRDDISFHVLQIIVGCQAFKGACSDHEQQIVKRCLDRWRQSEISLWKLRCIVHARLFRQKSVLERHLWLALAAHTASHESFPPPIAGFPDLSPSAFEEHVLREDLAEGPPRLWYNETSHQYTAAGFEMALFLSRSKAQLWRGYSVFSSSVLPEVLQNALALRPFCMFRAPRHRWQDVVATQDGDDDEEPLLHPVQFELFFRRITKVLSALPPQHLLYLRFDGAVMSSWWALTKASVHVELPRDPSKPQAPSRGPLPEQWRQVLVQRKIQGKDVEIEELVGKLAPPCMRQLLETPELKYDGRFAYAHLYGITGLSAEHIYRMRESKTLAQYARRPHAESEVRRMYQQIHTVHQEIHSGASGAQYGWRCDKLQEKGLCPVFLDHVACAAQTQAIGPDKAEHAARRLARWETEKIRPLKKLLIAYDTLLPE